MKTFTKYMVIVYISIIFTILLPIVMLIGAFAYLIESLIYTLMKVSNFDEL